MNYTTMEGKALREECKKRGIPPYAARTNDGMISLLQIYDAANPTITNTKIRYIDLFCGLGAFHTAFNTSSRFECVLACDIDEGARAIYELNYGLKPEGDIRKINTTTMPDFDILCAGFPCQPFSIAGNGEGFKDTTKGNLFYDILKIIDAKTPPMCILENVKNLETHDKGKTYATIIDELKKRGYIVTSKVINAVQYGSPQARQRIFIVATRTRSFAIPPPAADVRVVRSILDPAITRNDLDMTKYTTVAKPEKKGVVVTSKPHVLMDVFPIPSATKQAKLEKKAKDEGKPLVLKGGRQGERVYSVDAVGVTVCASSGGPGAKTGLYKVGEAIRRLTVKETLGMFGFPPDYKWPNTVFDEDRLFYLGNSIVVDVPKAFVPAVLAWFS